MNFLYYWYFTLPNFARFGFFGKAVNKVMAMALKRAFDLFVPRHFIRTAKSAGMGITQEKRTVKYIISLTSFPARIQDVWISVECLLRQSVKADEIILWLAEEQFPDRKIPKSLTDLQSRGLTIRYCDDLRSHKKYYYAMLENPKDCIITFDDDLYYHKDVLKNVIELHKKFPAEVCTNRAHEIGIKNNTVLPYREWNHNAKNILSPSDLLLQTGGAGTLYPPGSLHKDAFDKELIRTLCFHADDVWLKLMCYLNGKKIVTNRFYNKDYFTVASTQNEKLVSQNVFDGGNDRQLKNICDHYGINLNELIH